MSNYFFPKLKTVEVLASYYLRTTWNTGGALETDVEGVLRNNPALAAILDPEIFARARVGEQGGGIEWMDAEFGADNIYAWAKEQAGQVSHEMFGAWMHRNQLSLSTAAAALGISRRMVSYYRAAHKAIPRAIWLACLGWEAIFPQGLALPRTLPTVREYAATHP